MRYMILALGLCAGTAANAGCFADYKAKQDNPLKLHYGVAQLDDAACGSRASAQAALAQRLTPQGWTLLSLLSLSDNPTAQQKENAGEYFLRY